MKTRWLLSESFLNDKKERKVAYMVKSETF